MTQAFPKPSRRLRLGFVGGGQGLIGDVHANAARLSNRWEVVAGALSSKPDVAQESGRDWLLAEDRIYTDYREMARAEGARADGIDAVAIVTPNHLHAEVALAFMEAGIDVITDKPLSTSLAEAKAVVAKQRETGLVVGVTYAYASHHMMRQARAMVAAGQLGDVRQVHVEYFQDWAMDLAVEPGQPVPWRMDPKTSGPSFTVADIGTHAEHLVRFVSGLELDSLRAEFHVTGQPKPMEDTAFMHLRFQGGVPGTLMVSQTFAGSQCGLRLRICGSKAMLEWNQEEPEFLTFRQVGEPVQILSRGHGAGMLPEAERFVRMPRGHPEALTDAWANLYTEFAVAIDARRTGAVLPDDLLAYPNVIDGLKGMEFTLAAVESHQNGVWVEVPKP